MYSNIGTNLKDLRMREGLTLRELSSQTGLSPTLLSQVERGITQPTLKTLRALSHVFGSEASTLFTSPLPVTVHHSKPGQRSKISSPVGKIQYERLTPNNGQIEVLLGNLQAGNWSSDSGWSHEAVECVYVVSGTLCVEINGEQFSVEPHESLTLSASMPHRYGNLSDKPVVFTVSVSPPTP